MEENTVSTEVGTEAFFSAFEESGYQTGNTGAEDTETQTEAETQQTADNQPQEGQDTPRAEETGGENGQGGNTGEKGTEGAQKDESFTIKVNKEERTVTREELIALAQKGADYDRVKAKSKSDNEALSQQIETMKPVYDLIGQIAKDAGMEVEALLDGFQIQRLRNAENLSEDAAKERLGRIKAERELEKMKAAPTPAPSQKDRADREIAQFQEEFPDVPLGDIPVAELTADIQAGKPLTQAYRNWLLRSKDAEIQRLKADVAAAEQNRRNKQASPGSTSDAGARTTKSATDDFWAAFE